jgi:tRNA-specific 2-thiouridylase
VLVALSGGVDSSVALAMLSHLGCEVHAVTFKNFCYGEADTAAGGTRACCSLESIEAARHIAQSFGARHWVTDVTTAFQERVIEPFRREYSAGRTLNPCLACNAEVRFPHLVHLARQLGLARVATGHYARLAPEQAMSGELSLQRGLDSAKDQAYFLYRVDRSLWPEIVFPLGWYRKDEVRAAARTLGLSVAERPESQDVCFVPEADRAFLFTAEDEAAQPGDIVSNQGQILGRHRGLIHYTVGQRRGLGIAAAAPLYVLALDRERNCLVVGPERELAARRVTCDQVVATITDFPATGPPSGVKGNWIARIRHRHAGTSVASWSLAEGELVVTLAEPARAVAPGQSLVLYRDDLVLGGGRIRVAA